MLLGIQEQSFQWLFPGRVPVNNVQAINLGHPTIMKAMVIDADHRAMLAIAHTVRFFHLKESFQFTLFYCFAQDSQDIAALP